ncbi:hypothetical protein BST97_03325 [Nonlabens spongiae]|uniref:Uncharacterized protein n=1 Tax=Nonlabens spongiae TaxID=331648 RepID=A0A1W6MHL2_9FLAO|nr:hypothetical protein [Nonlabens spongiae]ARN77104.1 hypothetical protein BST97_03325 [Nonlabens spongiae]
MFIILMLGGGAVLFKLYKKYVSSTSENPADNSRVVIKIDRKGNHRYDTLPETDNEDLELWIKIILAIAALALFFIPIDFLLNKS